MYNVHPCSKVILSNQRAFPIWMNEWMSIYLSIVSYVFPKVLHNNFQLGNRKSLNLYPTYIPSISHIQILGANVTFSYIFYSWNLQPYDISPPTRCSTFFACPMIPLRPGRAGRLTGALRIPRKQISPMQSPAKSVEEMEEKAVVPWLDLALGFKGDLRMI